MKPLKIARIALALILLICCSTWIMVQSRNISRLRSENMALRSQLEALQENPTEVERVQKSAPRLVRPETPSEEHERYEKEHRELLRLRNEMSRLRQEKEEIKAARLAELNTQTLAAV